MRNAALILFVSGFLILNAFASDKTTNSRILPYLEAIGMREMLDERREFNRAIVFERMKIIMEQLKTDFSEASPEFLRELEILANTLAAEVTVDYYTTDEILQIYAEPFDRNYSGERIEEAASRLSTPEGKRWLLTIREAESAVMAFTEKRQKVAVDEAMQRYILGVKELLAIKKAGAR